VAAALRAADGLLLSWGEPLLLAPIEPYRTINGYGLFRVMTTTRFEIVVEGSLDGEVWHPYEFHWKPGDPARPPGFVEPHQPRLDWQMWFAALSPQGNAWWLERLMVRLLADSQPVEGLLERSPFPHGPPRFVRLTYWRYRFTDRRERRESGRWWRREALGPLTPPLQAEPGQRGRGGASVSTAAPWSR
jgi:hypothetical protein